MAVRCKPSVAKIVLLVLLSPRLKPDAFRLPDSNRPLLRMSDLGELKVSYRQLTSGRKTSVSAGPGESTPSIVARVLRFMSSTLRERKWASVLEGWWIAKHGYPNTVPPGMPRDVLNKLNGLNVKELRARNLIAPRGAGEPGNIRGGRYLNPGPTLFTALNIISLAPSFIDEYEAERDLEMRAKKHGQTPEEQFWKDSERMGHPQFYMTPFGPMPNPHYGGRNNPMLKASLPPSGPHLPASGFRDFATSGGRNKMLETVSYERGGKSIIGKPDG